MRRAWPHRKSALATLAFAALGGVGALTSSPACATGGAPFIAEAGGGYAMPVRTIKEIAHARAFRSTLHQRYDFSCGSAAVATLLTY